MQSALPIGFNFLHYYMQHEKVRNFITVLLYIASIHGVLCRNDVMRPVQIPMNHSLFQHKLL